MDGRIDLDRARREAKRRVKAAGGALKLADAQRAVARELGEPSWPRLVRRVEAEAVAREDRARQLVREATDGRRDHAEALLALDPDLGREGLDAALVLGEAERVRSAIARDPGLVARPTRRARMAAAALPLPLRVPRRGADRRAGRLRAGSARGGRRPGLELAASGVRRPRRAVRRGGRRARAAHDRAAAGGGREPGRRRVRLPLHRDRRRHLPAAAARRRRQGRGHQRDRALPRHRAAGDAAAAARPRGRARGAALAAVGDLSRTLAGGDPDAGRRRRRRERVGRAEPAHALRAGLADGAARPLRAARRRSARGARSARSTS